jgi:hypothetical protein
MKKETKLYLGVAAVALGGYLLWNKYKKDKPVVAAAPATPSAPASFAGQASQNVVGYKSRMPFAGNKRVPDSGWVRMSGFENLSGTEQIQDWSLRRQGVQNEAEKFYDTKSSSWVRGN